MLHIAPRLTVEPGNGEASDVAATIAGTAAQLYLALWNRGEEIKIEGDAGVLDRWRATQRIRWT